MSGTEDDDYLSDKFIVADTVAVSSTTSLNQSATYTERRRQASRVSELKSVQNRKKSKRQLEEESLKEGLGKSLFEKAAENSSLQNGNGNKAMNMMLKMGFKPGQSLGVEDKNKADETSLPVAAQNAPETVPSRGRPGHLVEPIRVEIWSGREGVGKRKRNVSPAVAAKLAKLVQDSAEEQMRGSYRERTRAEYEEKRAEGRLRAARLTCITLDEEAGEKFNVYWLDLQDPETFPPDLLEILTTHPSLLLQSSGGSIMSQEERLRRQMRVDALQSPHSITGLGGGEEDDEAAGNAVILDEIPTVRITEWPEHVVQEVKSYISADARARLKMTLEYLRSTHMYCFWCGTRYEDAQDLEKNCPGLEEEDHD